MGRKPIIIKVDREKALKKRTEYHRPTSSMRSRIEEMRMEERGRIDELDDLDGEGLLYED